VFAVAVPGAVEFDDLLNKVLAIPSDSWVIDIEHGGQQESSSWRERSCLR
jgi:hypothetical protein